MLLQKINFLFQISLGIFFIFLLLLCSISISNRKLTSDCDAISNRKLTFDCDAEFLGADLLTLNCDLVHPISENSDRVRGGLPRHHSLINKQTNNDSSTVKLQTGKQTNYNSSTEKVVIYMV